jgi:hypothetical protein
LAAAVPDVHVTATGRPLALAMPSAKNPAERSSSTDTASSSDRPARVSVRGALREPGLVTAWRIPQRTSSSTNACNGAYVRLIGSTAWHAIP